MPLTDCPTHGESGAVEMCQHLHRSLQAGVYETFTVVPVFPVRICAECAQAHGVPELLAAAMVSAEQLREQRANDPGLRAIAPDHVVHRELLAERHPELLTQIESIYDAVNARSRMMCCGCIDAVQVSHARASGAPLPCEPFEKTIVNGSDPRLFALAELVRAHLNPRGNHEGRFYGCQVFAGTALRPLRVRVFGVVDEAERAAMTRRIDAFFEGAERFQREVQYFEAMAWDERVVEGSVTRTRRPLVLVAETLVRGE